MPIIKRKKDKQNKHAKFMVTLPRTWQTATLFSSLLNVFKEGASTTVGPMRQCIPRITNTVTEKNTCRRLHSIDAYTVCIYVLLFE